uniref:Uncharacterized protein n=1 Tax=Siphoviridae sp. ctXOZ1 TaxID=2823585 RepID=A0A8S5LBC6_9CAUD|nr:MAG TPA: hypothetical protein [Siphoviridae sp. ctXOZ1]
MIIDNDNEFDAVRERIDHALLTGADKAAQAVVEHLKRVPDEIIESVQEAVRNAVEDLRDCSHELIEDA